MNARRSASTIRAVASAVALSAAVAACGQSGGSSAEGSLPTVTVPGAQASATAAARPSATGFPSPPTAAQLTMPEGVATANEVSRLVVASQGIRKVPADLEPPLPGLARDSENIDADGCDAQVVDTKVGPCAYGSSTATKSVVVIGDNHAAMWQPAFDLIGKRAGWKAVILAKTSCPAPTLSLIDFEVDRPYTECDTWHSYVQQRVARLSPDIAVVTSAFFDPVNADRTPTTDQQWTAGLVKTLTGLKKHAKSVFVLGDMPYSDQDPATCLASHSDDATKCAPTAGGVRAGRKAAERAAAAATSTTYVDVEPWMCAAYCPAVVGNIAPYRDQFHISTVWARFLSGVLQESLGIT